MSSVNRNDYRRRSYSRQGNIRKKKKKPRLIYFVLIVAAIAALAIAASIVLGYNPFLESQLRSQFGDEFFSDFGNMPTTDSGGDLDEIINDYEPLFQALEDKALERLESLFEQAIKEYQEQEGDGTLDRFVLTNKYIQAGRILENNVDEAFYSLLGSMENDLLREGHPTNVLAEIEKTYEGAKDEKKRDLLNRLRRIIEE